ncbi:Hsp20/alpha crystallin family protein [Tuwongella immobilis]|uniref:SHSP domain-containing protein n=1 Tax=Tuwongella immobilis TaxID=692036 RepID=A0A6C2YLN5_9BACT|nr:Hsp20/alpha crystallin family protein [Tuwongella immobilis]VIP02277.1 Heat shock protein, HSP20 OS=Rhodopirellula maiorica SM1 GN=RMSM_05792 PE=3 SV=1: HSP20 [Tuwongella immobilis]VTS00917.1 Heat shock protein, HSP20 OS=Rhodopirellula maiorica SM1 GN=RMSM_05792 PE=3 SV=1: HSP20 [Tuwongella immobilis]
MLTHYRRDPLAALFQEANRMQSEVSRLFGRGLFTPEMAVAGPLLNVWEDDHAFYVETDLPGLTLETIDITLTEGNQLTISGDRKPVEVPSAIWHRQERPTGAFSRSVTLPALVDADKVEAVFESGVLKVTLPKSEAAKPRKIAVKSV